MYPSSDLQTSSNRQFFQLLLKKIRQIFPYVQQTLLEDGKEKKVEISPRRSPRNANSRLVFHILERHECIRSWKKLKCPRKFIRVPLQGYTMLKIDLENTRTIFLTKKKKNMNGSSSSHLLHISYIHYIFIFIIKPLCARIHLWKLIPFSACILSLSFYIYLL